MSKGAVEMEDCAMRRIHFHCVDCDIEYPPGKKLCEECGRPLRYHCVGTNNTGRYDNYARHRRECYVCGRDWSEIEKERLAKGVNAQKPIEEAYEGTYRTVAQVIAATKLTCGAEPFRLPCAEQPPWSKWKVSDAIMRANTGFTLDEIDFLASLAQEQLAALREQTTYKGRLLPSPRNLLLLALKFVRSYPSKSELAAEFGLPKGSVSAELRKVVAALLEPFDPFIRWPTRTQSLHKKLHGFTEHVVCAIDTTHLMVSKPHHNAELIKRLYHIKSKTRYGWKEQLVVGLDGRIWHQFGVYGGATDDRTILEASGVLHKLSPTCKAAADLGYQKAEWADRVLYGHKRKPHKDLSVTERLQNGQMHSVRSIVENVHARLKVEFKVMGSLWRGDSDDQVFIGNTMRLCALLMNYLLDHAPVRSNLWSAAHPVDREYKPRHGSESDDDSSSTGVDESATDSDA